jgi:hypothetical protein
MNKYEKIFTVVVVDAPRILLGEEHRSRSGTQAHSIVSQLNSRASKSDLETKNDGIPQKGEEKRSSKFEEN